MADQRIIGVAGDITVDWNLARTKRSDAGGSVWFTGDRTCASRQRGGAAMLAELIGAVAGGVDGWVARGAADVDTNVLPGDAQFHHSYALWALSERHRDKPGAEAKVWRVAEFLGLDRQHIERKSQTPLVGLESASILVLDDADLGFRENEAAWRALLSLGAAAKGALPRWIVLKMARPVGMGSLWTRLMRRFAERVIVVMTVNDLRLSKVQVSRELSWERTAQDLAWELVHNPNVNALSHCRHVVVSFDTAGAFVMSRRTTDERAEVDNDPSYVKQEPGPFRFRLFFDPEVVEGMWAAERPGGVIGYTSCLTTAICRALMHDPESPAPDLGLAVRVGLQAMRKLHTEGYGYSRNDAQPQLSFPRKAGGRTEVPEHVELAFPTHEIARAIVAEVAGKNFCATEVRDPAGFEAGKGIFRTDHASAGWTILQRNHAGQLFPVARKLVLRGPKAALVNVPLGRFGNLLTVDRREIESFRSIRGLVAEYVRQDNPKRPLSIAVFGAPGAGKSFAVTEAAKALLGKEVEPIEFNLSQLTGPEALYAAFHRVRDSVLTGKLPLVFWDEFDTRLDGRELGWLRYFLAPMQDGKFLDGEIVHPIGRSIFVFAGGTARTMREFSRVEFEWNEDGQAGKQAPPVPAGDGHSEHDSKSKRHDPVDPWTRFKDAKGPDFVSRLKGFIDIAGPNPKPDAASDPQYVLRRAILLRSLLERVAPQLFADGQGGGDIDIDAGVLRALLEVPKYRHGARSVEAILNMSRLAGRSKFEQSSLPPAAQLELHVDSTVFFDLLQYDVFDEKTLEVFAAKHHAVYRKLMSAEDRAKKPYMALDFADLPEDIKEDNRQAVRNIPNKLAAAGYVMIRARPGTAAKEFPGDEIDRLAEMEHDRWMRGKFRDGWRYGTPRDDKAKLHPSLLPWKPMTDEQLHARYSQEELDAMGDGVLSDKDKAIDVGLVQAIPDILWLRRITVEPVAELEAGANKARRKARAKKAKPRVGAKKAEPRSRANKAKPRSEATNAVPTAGANEAP